MEVTKHTAVSKGDSVSVYLEGLQKKDGYGTNLNLTGQSNWFGSLNMCSMMADNSHQLFASIDDNSECTESGLNYSLLELGSGLGRAGLMALKLIDLESKRNLTMHLKPVDTEHCLVSEAKHKNASSLPSWNCVLSDGEEEVTELLTNNYTRNFPAPKNVPESTTSSSANTPCVCQQLWWGENADLQALRQKHPQGFDLIIGADLIYGRDETSAVDTENEEENTTKIEEKAEDGFCRDKLKSLLYTVSALLSHRGSSTSSNRSINNCTTDSNSTNNEGSAHSTTLTADQSSHTTDVACVIPSSSAGSCSSKLCTPTQRVPAPVHVPVPVPVGDFDVKQRPAFYLAITRRELLPMDELRAVALSAGLQVSLLEDYTFDIFDQNVDSESMFWRDTILLFTRV